MSSNPNIFITAVDGNAYMDGNLAMRFGFHLRKTDPDPKMQRRLSTKDGLSDAGMYNIDIQWNISCSSKYKQ